jgi:hypothetical protein
VGRIIPYGYRQQQAEIMAAKQVIEELPLNTVWSLFVTDEDTPENPGVLNIFAVERAWPVLIDHLRLDRPVDEGETFKTFRVGPLLVSLIEQEVVQ